MWIIFQWSHLIIMIFSFGYLIKELNDKYKCTHAHSIENMSQTAQKCIDFTYILPVLPASPWEKKITQQIPTLKLNFS